MKIKPLELTLSLLLVALAVFIGWMLSSDATRDRQAKKKEESNNQLAHLTKVTPEQQQSGNAPKKSQPGDLLGSPYAIPNERLVRFATDEKYRRFLASLDGSKLRLLGSIDALRAVRVGFDDLADLDGALSDDEQDYNYLVTLPESPGEGAVQSGALGFNGNALEWLGITGDNSTWGTGVKLAIIDTGISPHPALPDNIIRYNLVTGEDPNATWNGHGTAVASLIAGTTGVTPGVAPGTQLIDIRVADSNGNSSSFQLAEGIVTAVDAGAHIINISMGSNGDSLLVRDAVAYASSRGVVIVASSGNEGRSQPAYPAGYPDVIAVGAVDRNGTLVNFSNTGKALDITAPGLSVFSAWTDDRYIEFTGTSASAPFVAAAVAVGMSQFRLPATSSSRLVTSHANEAGSPGADSSYGSGLLDVGRIINSQTSGIFDLAAVSNLVSPAGNSIVSVVQNQGTAIINNATAVLNTPFEQIPLSIPRLAPGEIQTFEFPVNLQGAGNSYSIETSTSLNPAFTDSDPANNSKSTFFQKATPAQ